jgi:hypothetical protein
VYFRNRNQHKECHHEEQGSPTEKNTIDKQKDKHNNHCDQQHRRKIRILEPSIVNIEHTPNHVQFIQSSYQLLGHVAGGNQNEKGEPALYGRHVIPFDSPQTCFADDWLSRTRLYHNILHAPG